MNQGGDIQLEGLQFSMAGKSNPGEDVILLACIGAGSYQRTIYVDKEVDPPRKFSVSGYAFDAVVKREGPNKILFIGTHSSSWLKLDEFYGKSEPGSEHDRLVALCGSIDTKSDDPAVKEIIRRICDAISTHIRDKAGFEDVRIVLTPFGRNNAELTEYFEKVREALSGMIIPDRRTRIIFDISNGFRSMPMFVMMLVKYLNLISNTDIRYSAYYGMFDAKFPAGKDDPQTLYTPLVDMRMITELTEWVNAISEFRNFGSVKMLLKCLAKEREESLSQADELRAIDTIIAAFRDYEYGTNANNLYYLQKSICAITQLNTAEYTFLTEPARLILQSVVEYFDALFGRFVRYSGCEADDPFHYAYLQIRLAQMYTEQTRYGAASIALCEGVTTYMIEQYDQTAIQNLRLVRRVGGESAYVEILFDFDYRDRHEKKTEKKFGIQPAEVLECWGKCLKEGRKSYRNKYNITNKEIDNRINLEFVTAERDCYGLEFLLMRIKDLIRNPQAHNLYSDLTDSFDGVLEIREWLQAAINSILADMKKYDDQINYDGSVEVLPFRLYEFF